MSEKNPADLDIFKVTYASDYVACVGENGFHDYETYATGYMRAAHHLLDKIAADNLLLERDTIVFPILYNARHGMELSLKGILIELTRCNLRGEPEGAWKSRYKVLIQWKQGHRLNELWSILEECRSFDRRLDETCGELSKVIKKFTAVDETGEDFRYPLNRANTPTMKEKYTVDLVSAKELLAYAEERFLELFHVVEKITEERGFKSFTSELNREELRRLSLELPPIEQWGDGDEFSTVREAWKDRLELSSKAFDRAIEFIKKHREFASNIGIQASFEYLTKDLLSDIVEAAFEVAIETGKDSRSIVMASEVINGGSEDCLNAYEMLKDRLTGATIAEMSAIFYTGCHRKQSEEYELTLQHLLNISKGESDDGKRVDFLHLFGGSHFVHSICIGLKTIGMPKMANEFHHYVDELDTIYAKQPSIQEFKIT
ncbi:MAG: hypothetical protein ACSHYA_17285 [Opitutaceae bacterium]